MALKIHIFHKTIQLFIFSYLGIFMLLEEGMYRWVILFVHIIILSDLYFTQCLLWERDHLEIVVI